MQCAQFAGAAIAIRAHVSLCCEAGALTGLPATGEAARKATGNQTEPGALRSCNVFC